MRPFVPKTTTAEAFLSEWYFVKVGLISLITDSEKCNTTDKTPSTWVIWLSLLILWLFLNTLHQGTTRLLCLKTAAGISPRTGSPRASPCRQKHLISNLYRCGVLIDSGRSDDPDRELLSITDTIFGPPTSVWSFKETPNLTSLTSSSLKFTSLSACDRPCYSIKMKRIPPEKEEKIFISLALE